MDFWEGFKIEHPEHRKYEEKYRESVIVLKAGEEVMEGMLEPFLYDTAILWERGSKPVIVYGAKGRIDDALKRAGIKDLGRSADGNRITTKEMIDVIVPVQEEMSKEIISELEKHGAKAEVGYTYAMQLNPASGEYVGFVGDPYGVDHNIKIFLNQGIIPIIPFIGISTTKYNVNADIIACVAAPLLGATSLLYLTGEDGVLDSQGSLISELTQSDAERMIKEGVINKGMVPKVRCALKARKDGVEAVHIINGMRENAILYELFTDKGRGTMIK